LNILILSKMTSGTDVPGCYLTNRGRYQRSHDLAPSQRPSLIYMLPISHVPSTSNAVPVVEVAIPAPESSKEGSRARSHYPSTGKQLLLLQTRISIRVALAQYQPYTQNLTNSMYTSNHPQPVGRAASRLLLFASFLALRSIFLALLSSFVSVPLLARFASFLATLSADLFFPPFSAAAFFVAFSAFLIRRASLLIRRSALVSPSLLLFLLFLFPEAAVIEPSPSLLLLAGVASVDVPASLASGFMFVPSSSPPLTNDEYSPLTPMYFPLFPVATTTSSWPFVTDWVTAPFLDVSRPLSFWSKACSHHWSLVTCGFWPIPRPSMLRDMRSGFARPIELSLGWSEKPLPRQPWALNRAEASMICLCYFMGGIGTCVSWSSFVYQLSWEGIRWCLSVAIRCRMQLFSRCAWLKGYPNFFVGSRILDPSIRAIPRMASGSQQPNPFAPWIRNITQTTDSWGEATHANKWELKNRKCRKANGFRTS